MDSVSRKSRPKYSLGRWVPYAALVVTVLGAGVFYIFWNNRSVVDKSVVDQATFTVYTPKSAPSGFSIDSAKTELSGELLTYSFSSEKQDKSISVTVQPLPPNFDMQQLIGSGTVTSTSTNNGILYDLSAGGVSKFLLNTGDALIFFTAPGRIDTATVNSLASSLVRR